MKSKMRTLLTLGALTILVAMTSASAIDLDQDAEPIIPQKGDPLVPHGYWAEAEVHAECFNHHGHFAIHEAGQASAGKDRPYLIGDQFQAEVWGTIISDSDAATDRDVWAGDDKSMDAKSGRVTEAGARGTASFGGIVMAIKVDTDKDECPVEVGELPIGPDLDALELVNKVKENYCQKNPGAIVCQGVA